MFYMNGLAVQTISTSCAIRIWRRRVRITCTKVLATTINDHLLVYTHPSVAEVYEAPMCAFELSKPNKALTWGVGCTACYSLALLSLTQLCNFVNSPHDCTVLSTALICLLRITSSIVDMPEATGGRQPVSKKPPFIFTTKCWWRQFKMYWLRLLVVSPTFQCTIYKTVLTIA